MKKLIMILPLLLGVMFFACNDDEGNPIIPDDTTTSIWVEEGGYWSSLVDAHMEDDYIYFSFANQETVSVADAPNNNEWDIACSRYHIILNGGLYGNKGVSGVDLAAVGSADSIDFAAVVDTLDVTESDWEETGITLAVDDWYFYDPITHQLNPSEYVYLIYDAEGTRVKFQVIDMFDGSMPPDMGSVTLRFVNGVGSDVSGTPDTLTLTIGTGTGYIDFSTMSEVTPTDPANSLDWDIAITSYEIHLNFDIYGAGNVSAYPAFSDTDLVDNPADFDGLTYAPALNPGYLFDSVCDDSAILFQPRKT